MRAALIRIATLGLAGLLAGVAASAQPPSDPAGDPIGELIEPSSPPPAPRISKPQTRDAFRNETLWHDTDGLHINAHGGGVLFHDGVYYWYGEARGMRTPETRWPPSPNVSVYSSRDLYNWKNEGIALATLEDESSEIVKGCNIERPKVIYNEKTKQFVMWI